MPYQDRTHGDLGPVTNVDTPEYTAGAVSAVTVQIQGPKLDFATITKTSGGWSADDLNAIMQVIQSRATVYLYEWTDTSNDTLAVAFYPTEAWGDVTATAAGSLDAEVTTVTAACSIAASATFTG